MKCHYEVLNVPRDADEATIKSAYKKLALKWHPDKNLDNPEEAKAEFQLVQQAYEVLSDRQERAWYDNHREQILHASKDNFEDNSLDVFQYFTTSCFKGYGDDDNGFYAVYRKVFEQIAKEDMEFMENKDEFCEIPSFGYSTSDYETVVAPFYAYWSSYSTKKSYVWLDIYKVTELRGKMLKLAEKENKKVRQKAKKERNEEIRNLVAFVKKRDKRVQAYAKLQEAKKLENKKKQEQLNLQRKLERQKELNQSGTEAEWAKFDNVKSELEQIEKQIAEEFGASDSEDDEYSLYNNNLYCIACKKLFRKERAFQAHENTKKHKDNVERLRNELLDDESENSDLGSDALSEIEDEAQASCEDFETNAVTDTDSLGDESNSESVDLVCSDTNKKSRKKKVIENGNENNLDYDGIDAGRREQVEVNLADNSDVSEETPKPKKQKKKKKQNVLKTVDSDDQDISIPLNVDSDCDFDSSSKNKKKNSKKNKQKAKTINKEEFTKVDPSENAEKCDNENDAANLKNDKIDVKKVTKSGNKKNKKQENLDIGDIDTAHCCAKCKSEFPSKNKLFEHLKKTGHSTYLPKNEVKEKSKRKK